jgi:hypothetical protein
MIAAAKNHFLKSLLSGFPSLGFLRCWPFSSAVHVGFFGRSASLISLTLFPTIGVFPCDTFRSFPSRMRTSLPVRWTLARRRSSGWSARSALAGLLA